jgi:ferric-dicitrate binding protein FerR (iron transport regulator)
MNEAGKKNILFHKHLSGQSTPREEEQLKALLFSENDKTDFEQVNQIWNLSEDIQFGVQAQTGEEWHTFLSRIEASRQPKVRTLHTVWFRAIAAVIAIGLLGTAVWFTGVLGPSISIAETYQTPAGGIDHFDLIDGSSIALNNQSTLQVIEGFNETERKLILEGEAHFQVASDQTKPFQIQTGDVSTIVVGTAFNLSAYPEDEQVTIDVTEGIVRFVANDGQRMELRQGMSAKFDKSTGHLSKVDFDKDALLWQKGVVSFNNTPFREVMRTLERHYNIQIEDKKGLEDEPYTASFNNKTQEEVFLILQETFDFKLIKEGSKLILQ